MISNSWKSCRRALLARESVRSAKQATKRSNVASWEWRIPRGRIDSGRIAQEKR